MTKKLIVTVFTAIALMLVPAVASASNDSPSDFGQHVAKAAQLQHFDGTHNPGMHQGKNGWPHNHAG